jgi:hypothetical protein
MSLKNCPFCGGGIHPERITRTTGRGVGRVDMSLYAPQHDNPLAVCLLADSGLLFADVEALEAAWNKRSATAAAVELDFNEAIEQAVKDHIADEDRIWTQGEGTEKPKGLLK